MYFNENSTAYKHFILSLTLSSFTRSVFCTLYGAVKGDPLFLVFKHVNCNSSLRVTKLGKEGDDDNWIHSR